jgi:uncharacterized protein (TIGR02996 family)
VDRPRDDPIALTCKLGFTIKPDARNAALFSTILEHPDDDAPRLVYADALQSSGKEEDAARGELITIQCELAENGWDADRLFLDWAGDERVDEELLDSGRFAKLRRREADILREHGIKWVDRGTPALKPIECFRRGFVEHLYINASEKLSDVFKRYPFLRAISATVNQPATARTFFRTPELRSVRELNLQSSVVRFMADLKNENLANLRHLMLQHLGGQHDLDALATAPWFPNLETLILYSFSLNTKTTTALGESKVSLRELQIVDSRMGRDAVSAIVTSGALGHVRTLALRHARLGEGDASLFTLQKDWRALSALDLRTNSLRAKDAALIADQLPNLRVLDLGNNATFGSEGVKELKGASRIRSLGLQRTGLEDVGLTVLAKSPLMKNLRVLDLRKNAITDKGIKAFVRAAGGMGAAEKLTLLFLGTQIADVTKKALKETLPSTRIY